jgi:hypothetical protein
MREFKDSLNGITDDDDDDDEDERASIRRKTAVK